MKNADNENSVYLYKMTGEIMGKMDSELLYKIAPLDWTPEDQNPYEPDGVYGKDYSGFYLSSAKDDHVIIGTSETGLFHVSVHKEVSNIHERLIDFIRYENTFNRIPIIGSDYIFELDELINSIDIDTYAVRDTDPTVLVHSTSLEAWDSIQKDYYLKSSLQLEKEKIGFISIGHKELKEPDEYKNFIMFGGFGCNTEFIVLSQQRGFILCDKNCEYIPGVRIYLDCHKMIRDKIIFRDGLHTLKVKQKLDLKEYMIDCISTGKIDAENNLKTWTPEIFSEKCDEYFHNNFFEGVDYSLPEN